MESSCQSETRFICEVKPVRLGWLFLKARLWDHILSKTVHTPIHIPWIRLHIDRLQYIAGSFVLVIPQFKKKKKRHKQQSTHAILFYYEAFSDPITAPALLRLYRVRFMQQFPPVINNVQFILTSLLPSIQKDSLYHQLSHLFSLDLINDCTWHCNWNGFK